MTNLMERYYDRVVELTEKYPELLAEIRLETIWKDDHIADIVGSIKMEDMEREDFITLCMYSRLLDAYIGVDPTVVGIYVIREADIAGMKDMRNEIIKFYNGRTETKVRIKTVFSVSETAALLGITNKQVKRLIKHGQLSAKSLFNHFYIVKSELERFINNNNSI